MSQLKDALLSIKNISEKDFQSCYDIIVQEYLNENTSLNLSYDIDELEKSLDIHVINVNSIVMTFENKIQKIFALPTYDWDGGNPIYTKKINLRILASNDFGGGPGAEIVTLKNHNYPGIALYRSYDLNEIHIFSN